MSSILTNEAVIRVQKALNEFNENIKIIILESNARIDPSSPKTRYPFMEDSDALKLNAMIMEPSTT